MNQSKHQREQPLIRNVWLMNILHYCFQLVNLKVRNSSFYKTTKTRVSEYVVGKPWVRFLDLFSTYIASPKERARGSYCLLSGPCRSRFWRWKHVRIVSSKEMVYCYQTFLGSALDPRARDPGFETRSRHSLTSPLPLIQERHRQ